MTTVEERVVPVVVRARREPQVWQEQLRGIDAWVRAHRKSDEPAGRVLPRERRLDLARQQDLVERQRVALVGWTERCLRSAGDVLCLLAAPRVLIVHRNAWFTRQVSAQLAEGGVVVVAELDNGADAVGVAVAEQPDLVVVEDKLPMMSGLEVARAVRRYAPSTAVVAHVQDAHGIGAFLDLGATAAYTRRVPASVIAAELVATFDRGRAWSDGPGPDDPGDRGGRLRLVG